MGGGNGAKSQQARERNAAKAKAGPTSQLKQNAAAQTLKCSVCMQTFQSTSKQPQLQQHVEGKHPKATFTQCFPTFAAA